MSPLDELYTEYSHIKTVKEKGLLSLDWNVNQEWKSIVKYFCEILDFKWSKGNDNNLYLYFRFLPQVNFSEEETKFIENGEWRMENEGRGAENRSRRRLARETWSALAILALGLTILGADKSPATRALQRFLSRGRTDAVTSAEIACGRTQSQRR